MIWLRPFIFPIAGLIAVAVWINGWGIDFGTTLFHEWQITQGPYIAQHGKWDRVQIQSDHKINAIHSIMLMPQKKGDMGKVLLMAGSGNNRANFNAGTFRSILYDPATGTTKLIPTPDDMFCSGHAHLPDGNILIAGGTQNYEILAANMQYAGGTVTFTNSSHTKDYTFKKGTEIVGSPSGKSYYLDGPVTIPHATFDKNMHMWMPEKRNGYAASVAKGQAGVWKSAGTFAINGLSAGDAKLLVADSPKMDLSKKEYEGTASTYIFDVKHEVYRKADPMKYARWYPTLTSITGGNVMAISGLDAGGRILDGQIEVFTIGKSGKWVDRKDLFRFFPTYPSVFQTGQKGILFSAGPSTGYGPADKGRDPALWNLFGNTYQPVKGLRDPGLLETGSASWLGPVNDQNMVVVGGGGVGDVNTATSRIDTINLWAKTPQFTPLANLQDKTRYPNLVTLPDGNMFITNGSANYRGRGLSNILKSYMLDYQSGKLTRMADPLVGRDYHASALLMPNGQIIVAGSDPLFSDKANTKPGHFEQEVDIYSPPYLFNKDGSLAKRPSLTSNGYPASIGLGQTKTLTLADASSKIAHVRLAYPGAVTHMTDTNQRLIELKTTQVGNKLTVTLPDNPSLVLPGDYMLFLVDSKGRPSNAVWIYAGADVNGSSHTSMASMMN